MLTEYNKQLWAKIIPDWTEQASCIDKWELFDSDIESIMGLDDIPLGMSVELYAAMAERRDRDRQALKVCWEECPVRRECLKDALEQGLEHTIRGGYLPSEREIMLVGYESGQHEQY